MNFLKPQSGSHMTRSGFCAAFILIGLALPALAARTPDCNSVAACSALAPETAGPALLRFLQDEDWDTRVAAAFALGSIEYKPSVPALVAALSNESDWQLAYAAIVSLSRMKDPSTLKPLREASSYWYPPVQMAAECAAQLVESGKPCDRHDELLNVDLSKLQSIKTDAGRCGDKRPRAFRETTANKRYGNEEAMQEFKYTGVECDWYGEVDQETGSKPCLAQRFLYPKVAARTTDGWFTGRDEGILGGELMFFPNAGKPYEILQSNVEDVYVLETSVIALTGLASDTTGSGMVYSLRQDGAGKWKADPMLRLHGAPESSYKVSKERIIVNSDGAMIIFDDHGNPEIAICKKRYG
jgi:hypothetical protein